MSDSEPSDSEEEYSESGDEQSEEESMVSEESGGEVYSEYEDDDDEADFLEDEDAHAAIQQEGISIRQDRSEFLSVAEKRNLTAAFDACDKTGSAELRVEEFMQALALMGKQITKKEGLKYFHDVDADSSGFITLDEWINFYANHMQFEVDERELKECFEGLWEQPTSGHPEGSLLYQENEYIHKDKIFEIMTKYGEKLTDEEAAEMVRECNPDEEGRVFFDAFRTMLIDTTGG